jgi:cell division inhibitor SepF
MVKARDAHDEWYEDDDRYERPLELVRPAELGFELVVPDSFEAARTIADRLRGGNPVIIDFHGCDRALVGRLTDFCSGLTYALDAGLQHLGNELLLLAPRHVDVSGDEASAVRSPGFYNRS